MSFLQASTKEQYLLRLALRLAQSYYSRVPVSLRAVATDERLSEKYLEELIVPLRQAGLVRSKLGRHGGYLFVKHPRQVTVKDILWLAGKKRSLAACLDIHDVCPLSKQCSAKQVWQLVQHEVETTLTSLTLDRLVKPLNNV